VLTIVFSLDLHSTCSILPITVRVGLTQPSHPKAAIIDQGSLAPTSGPNPVFITKATELLKEAGFSVDYYPGEAITVDFYRNLPNHNYDFIIDRTHSAIFNPNKDRTLNEIVSSPKKPHLCIFTNESVDEKKVDTYLFDVVNDRLIGSFYKIGDEKTGNLFFGITPCFVMLSMRWRFDGTTFIMMGCDGLKDNSMAQAFIQKGCKNYISWSGLISSDYSDKATLQLLHYLLAEKLSVKDAVDATMKKVGPDPKYKSVMRFYPIETEDKML
jgi:hypothetical protein